jgi:hypothetical protein
MGRDDAHLRFLVGRAKAVWFRAPPEAEPALRERVDLLVQLGVDTWQGRRSLSLKVQDLRLAPPA